MATTQWGNELANLQPDGTRSLESALKLFALSFGSILGDRMSSTGTGHGETRLLQVGICSARASRT